MSRRLPGTWREVIAFQGTIAHHGVKGHSLRLGDCVGSFEKGKTKKDE
jgi:hypothetical protein